VPPLAWELEEEDDVLVLVLEALVAVMLLVVLEEVVVLVDEDADVELLLIVVEDDELVAVADELVLLAVLEDVLLTVLVADVLLAVVVGVPEPFVVHQLVVHVGVAVLVLLDWLDAADDEAVLVIEAEDDVVVEDEYVYTAVAVTSPCILTIMFGLVLLLIVQ
jgi:hypothetical protein